jgi:hypothetical protein
MASALNRVGEGSLVLGARAGLAPRLDAAAVRNVTAEEAGVFVVDELNVVGAHDANAAATAAPVLGTLSVGTNACGSSASRAGASWAFERRAVGAAERCSVRPACRLDALFGG